MYVNPYQSLPEGSWRKANFHTHAGTEPGTCGKHPIGTVTDIYREGGYSFLCLSNHDRFIDGDSCSDEKMLAVPGVEYSRDCSHMLTVGVRHSFHELDHQAAIDETVKAGGFAILCHPNWPMQGNWPWEDIDRLRRYAGIEVINMLIYRLDGSGLASGVWDRLLTEGKLVYGFGNDDFHTWIDAARSFNLIHCAEITYASMKDAIDRGAFCASTGLYPDVLVLEGETLLARVKYPNPIHPTAFTYRFIGEGGRVLSEQRGEQAQYRLSGEPYVRVEAIGENGAMLFFQPVYRQGVLTKI